MEKQSKLDWGLLWFDKNPGKTFNQKVMEAALHYREKHGRWPDLCHVHPSALENGVGKLVSSIRVIGLKTVLKHHFWIGVEKEQREESQEVASS